MEPVVSPTGLETTPLDAFHRARGARMVPFAGTAMPLHYAGGIIAEHHHCRGQAALFDVSHMGQVVLRGAQAASALEALLPGDIRGLKEGRLRYCLFTNEAGGIEDDLMVTRRADDLYLVVNAARKAADVARLRAHLEPVGVAVEPLAGQALLALQGPKAAEVMARLAPETAALKFMTAMWARPAGVKAWISRSGYSGEDGFEVSIAAEEAPALAEALLAQPEVALAGLGARDSLRLEAGLCLYGQDIDATTTPLEAGLGFAISPRRREDGGFLGAPVILRQFQEGVDRQRVGLTLDGRQPARQGAEIVNEAGEAIGTVTSGGYGPTRGAAIAMGYVPPAYGEPGTRLGLVVRGKPLAATVAALPFVPHRYVRQAKGQS
ncbi:MAG: glycine cleavage system aminomethyltransferase GcvT [Pseudomonadota bacterium]